MEHPWQVVCAQDSFTTHATFIALLLNLQPSVWETGLPHLFLAVAYRAWAVIVGVDSTAALRLPVPSDVQLLPPPSTPQNQ